MLILITGASRGIGFELVRQFACSDADIVLAISRNTTTLEKLAKDQGLRNIVPVAADITQEEGLLKVLKKVQEVALPPAVIINNAGLLIKKDMSDLGFSDFLATYSTNVFAPFLLLQKVMPLIGEQGAHVVNISSMGGVQGSAKFVGLSAYASSKGALCVLTECLAEELKPRHIAVNCLALGAVQTEMLTEAFPGYEAPVKPSEMAAFIADFARKGQQFFNGKIIPVSMSTP